MTALRLQASVLPRPGPVWGPYPLRGPQDRLPPWRGWAGWRPPASGSRRLATAAARALPQWRTAFAGRPDEAQAREGLLALRRRLRREGLAGAAAADALAAAGAAAAGVLGLEPRPGQWLAAAALLEGHWVEMATGEGKTLALALAACVGGLAGLPVHAITANDYLAARDADKLAPLYEALGLQVAAVVSEDERVRRAGYAADVVYVTAKTLAFDHLRDEQGLVRGEPARLRGLCMALLDELDSILLDEAQVPLVLSRAAPRSARPVLLWQALAVARQLDVTRHVQVDAGSRQARLTAAGEQEAEQRCRRLGGPWQRPRFRREVLAVALSGLHALRRDEDYVVREGRIDLLDAVTGRAAQGRQWSRGLHTVVALKEGLQPPPETDCVARVTYQRFFQRYWRLSGLSGTVREARAELHRTYHLGLVRVPLHTPSRRIDGRLRVFHDTQERWDAVVQRVRALHLQGRPVLIGTDGVADAEALSAQLGRAGIEHRVLHALRDGDEAAIVAAAGRAGQVTLATRMAGRGTDIELDPTARAAGGLHVLNCQHNDSPRADRQLLGRAARHGDPGSTETWILARISGDRGAAAQPTLAAWTRTFFPFIDRWPWARLLHRMNQRLEERRCASLRAELLRQDEDWERRLPAASPWS